MHSIPDSAVRLVAPHFDEATLARALAYAREGRVHLVKADRFPVVAQVRGSKGYVVTVDYRPQDEILRGDCTCPVGYECKHAAATALVVFARQKDLLAQLGRNRSQEAVAEWLADLGRLPARSEPKKSEDKNRIAYVLDDADGEIALRIYRASQRKDGGLGKGTVLSFDPYRGLPQWVSDADLRRIAVLRSVARAGPFDKSLGMAAIDGEVLRDLASSGQLFWQNIGPLPLRVGPARRESLDFLPRDDNPDELGLGVSSGLVLVAARDCHYVDPVHHIIGPLDVGVGGELLQRLLSSPPVPPSMLVTVRANLRELLPSAAHGHWAAPTPDEELATEPMRPQVFFRLAHDEFSDETFEVRAEAVYGEKRFVLGEWQSLGAADEQSMRNMIAEGRRKDRLETLLARMPRRFFDDEAGRHREELEQAQFLAHHVVPQLTGEGWTCELDADFPAEPPLLDADWVEELLPLTDSHGWFSLELGVHIGGRTVPLLPILLRAIRDGRLSLDPTDEIDDSAGMNVRLPDGTLVHVPPDRLRRWLRPLVEAQLRGLGSEEELVLPGFAAAAVAEEWSGPFATSRALAEARECLQGLLQLEPRTEGKDFSGVLRPYQRQGLSWLRFLHDAGYGGLLADDMGLGKTVQVLAFLDGLRAARKLKLGQPALVVAPRSVVENWQSEARRFTSKLTTVLQLGSARARAPGELLRAHVVLTSYQTLVRDIELLRGISWTSVIFDEAQAMKNPDTKLRSAARSLPAQSRFCITGTPIENHLGELWSQMDLVMPGLLGRKKTFQVLFRTAIEKYGNHKSFELLRQRIRPFLLRRTKQHVELDLPPKTEIIERVELDTRQRDLYESLRLALDADVRKALKDRGLQGSSMLILDALLKLRQCCCDPRLLKIPEARKVDASAKLERLVSMLEELADAGRFVLVFSQFTSMLALIEAECMRLGISMLKLTGATSHRQQVIERFQNGEAQVFLISLKAGGVGLNLTRADTVIHYDPWWNPAAEDQATDRAHRIGQDKNVLVYKLVARGTLEERICDLQSEKRKLTESALRAGGVTHLGPKDLQALYREIV